VAFTVSARIHEGAAPVERGEHGLGCERAADVRIFERAPLVGETEEVAASMRKNWRRKMLATTLNVGV